MIKAEHLSKKFGRFLAVDDLSFQVEAGEVLGVLGPNGAGKSTTLRMVTGYLRPTAGRVEIQGIDLAEEPVKARQHLGYLPENAPLYSDCTVRGFLEFIAGIRGLNGREGHRAISDVMEKCQLETVANVPVEALSKGYRHRTCFAQALLGNPENMVLDEPTDGLDPNQKHDMRQLIRQLGKSRAVVVSTHILEEVEAICTRVAIVTGGRIVFDGTAAELRQRSSCSGSLRVRLETPVALTELRKQFASCTHLQAIRQDADPNWYVFMPKSPGDGGDLLQEVRGQFRRQGPFPQEMMVCQGDLEEVFRHMTEKPREEVE